MVKFEDLQEEAEKWAKEYCEALNDNENYEEAAKDWGIKQEGAMLFVMEASGEVEDDLTLFLDLKGGKCLGIKLLKPGEDPPRESILALRAPMLIWKKVAFQELDPIKGLMQNKLKVDGDMALAMRYSKAALELSNSTKNTDRTLLTKYTLEE
jgi:putative sterol carrier protein